MYMTCSLYLSPTRLSVSLDVIFLKSGIRVTQDFLHLVTAESVPFTSMIACLVTSRYKIHPVLIFILFLSI